jgi:uncharacterized membrane protein
LIFLFLISASFGLDFNGRTIISREGTSYLYAETSVQINDLKPENGVITDKSDLFTSKIGDVWRYELNVNRSFDTFTLVLTLPERSQIKEIGGNVEYTIMYEKTLKINFAENNVEPVLWVRYSVGDVGFNFLYLIITILLIALGSFIYLYFGKKTTKPLDHVTKTLNEKQKLIVDTLIQSGGSLNQNQLRHKTGLPKASLSRILNDLERKNIVVKEKLGLTNKIRISKDFKG